RVDLLLQGAQEPDDHHSGAGNAGGGQHRRAPAFGRTLGGMAMKHTLINRAPNAGEPNGEGVMIDRRATLRWMSAAMATVPLAACGESPSGLGWAEPKPLTGPGYGRDPNM